MNRRYCEVMIVLFVWLCFDKSILASEPARVPLRVLYLARTNADARTAAFKEFLLVNFASCRTESREEFQPEFTKDIDVVVLDWSQDERSSNETISPIGPLEDWNHPLVLLGSAGLLISNPWRVIGDAG